MEKTVVNRIKTSICTLRIISSDGRLETFLNTLQGIVEKKNNSFEELGIKSGRVRIYDVMIEVSALSSTCVVSFVIESVLGSDIISPIMSEVAKSITTTCELLTHSSIHDNMQKWSAILSYPSNNLSNLTIKMDSYTLNVAERAMNAIHQIPLKTINQIEEFLLQSKVEYESKEDPLQISEFCREETIGTFCLNTIMTYGKIETRHTIEKRIEFVNTINSFFEGPHLIPFVDKDGKTIVFSLRKTSENKLQGDFEVTIPQKL